MRQLIGFIILTSIVFVLLIAIVGHAVYWLMFLCFVAILLIVL